jgi:hypothetical protein
MGAKCVPRHEFLQHIAMERQRAPIQLAKGRVDCQRLAAGGGAATPAGAVGAGKDGPRGMTGREGREGRVGWGRAGCAGTVVTAGTGQGVRPGRGERRERGVEGGKKAGGRQGWPRWIGRQVPRSQDAAPAHGARGAEFVGRGGGHRGRGVLQDAEASEASCTEVSSSSSVWSPSPSVPRGRWEGGQETERLKGKSSRLAVPCAGQRSNIGARHARGDASAIPRRNPKRNFALGASGMGWAGGSAGGEAKGLDGKGLDGKGLDGKGLDGCKTCSEDEGEGEGEGEGEVDVSWVSSVCASGSPEEARSAACSPAASPPL